MKLGYIDSVQQINTFMENTYGKHPIRNLPHFRLAYAGDQYEKRQGQFSVYVDGTDVFLRTEVGIREVRKYLYLDDDTWIIERLVKNIHLDVIDGDFIYECVYAFPQIDHVPPLKAIVFFMNSMFSIGGVQKTQEEIDARAPKTAVEAVRRDEDYWTKEKKRTRAILDEKMDYTDLSLRLKHGAAVSINDVKMKEKEVENG